MLVASSAPATPATAVPLPLPLLLPLLAHNYRRQSCEQQQQKVASATHSKLFNYKAPCKQLTRSTITANKGARAVSCRGRGKGRVKALKVTAARGCQG